MSLETRYLGAREQLFAPDVSSASWRPTVEARDRHPQHQTSRRQCRDPERPQSGQVPRLRAGASYHLDLQIRLRDFPAAVSKCLSAGLLNAQREEVARW